MAILVLARDYADLRARLGEIIVGPDLDGKPVRADDLDAAGAMALLLRDAFLPNLVQTLEGDPAFIHGGPFANIAHGNSSVIGDRLALACADYVVTEAGFGSDMGAEKFMHIKAPVGQKAPDCVVMNVTVRSMKLHGGAFGDRLGGARAKKSSRQKTSRPCLRARRPTSTATSATCPDSACRSWSPSTASRATPMRNSMPWPMPLEPAVHTTCV